MAAVNKLRRFNTGWELRHAERGCLEKGLVCALTSFAHN
jgi:hypothetical protein